MTALYNISSLFHWKVNLHFRVVFPKKVKRLTMGDVYPPSLSCLFYGFFLILFPFVGYNIFHPHLILCWRILNEKKNKKKKKTVSFFIYLFFFKSLNHMNLYVRFVYTTIHINAKINYVSSSFEFYVLRCPWEITNKSNQHLYENVTFVMNQTDNNDNNKMRLEMCTNCCIIVVWMQTHQWQIQNKKFFSNCHHQELDGPE